jgi:hypothetical protein
MSLCSLIGGFCVLAWCLCCRHLLESGTPLKTAYAHPHVGVTRAALKGTLPKVVVKLTPQGGRSDGNIQVSTAL